MKIGFLGCGQMGGALARAVRRADPAAIVLLADADTKKRDALAAEISAKAAEADGMIREADYVFLGLKPQVLPTALAALGAAVAASRATFVSMAAGVTLATLAELLGDVPVIRMMPNTAVLVGAGMTVFAASPRVSANAKADFLFMMSASGRCDEIAEGQIDAACALSGCGPAFAYTFLEALADAGVECGLPRDAAIAYAAATVEGAMRMVSETGKHPAALRDAVCSPGGSTIAGVHALEDKGLRAAAMAAVSAAFKRTKELSGK
jgi:pyrroline-5-carboxylate reductase